MSIRDLGWIAVFAENGQEAIDMVIQAFKIAEDHRVMLPVLVNYDGFQLTHVVEAMMMPDQEEVDAFLPPRKPYAAIHPDSVVTMGALGAPDIYPEACMARNEALKNSKKVILEVWEEFEKHFGRKYEPIMPYRADDAEVVMLTMGALGETAQVAVDRMRDKGVKVGTLRVKLWRPFPFEELRNALKGKKVLIVLDRAVSYGGPGGPVFSEVRSAMFDEPERPVIINEIIALGGREMTVQDFINIFEKGFKAERKKAEDAYELYGVRGS